MDSDRVILVAGVTAVAAVVGTFILWGPTTAIRPKRRGAVIGLQNLGLTCYLNSLLQAMASCHYFVEWLNTQENQGEVATAMRKLLNVLCGNAAPFDDEYFVSPVEVVNALHHSGWKITNSQQDVHELLCNLITILEEEAHKSCVDLMISVDAVRSNYYSNKENIWPIISNAPNEQQRMRDENVVVASENDGNGDGACDSDSDDRDDASHTDLNSADKRLVNGIGCEGDAFARFHHTRTMSANDTIAPAMSELTENRITRVAPTRIKNGHVPRPRTAHDLNQSPRPSPFRGYLTNKIECTKCSYKSVLRYDKFDSISLHLPEPNEVNAHTLNNLLNNFVKNEIINGITCEGCNKNRAPNAEPVTAPAVKLLRFGKLPACLCIHIVRTSFHEYGVYKRQDYVDFPEYVVMDPYLYKPRKNNAFTVKKNTAAESNNVNANVANDDGNRLDASPAAHPNILNSAKHVYRLKAVIVHRGSHNDGHFMTYRRGTAGSQTQHRCSDPRWYLVSDTEVKETTLYNVIASVAYVLFYEKCSVFL